jgi:hypothetical protein
VLCSADAEYAAIVAELMPKLKALGRTTPVIVAGNPEDAPKLCGKGRCGFRARAQQSFGSVDEVAGTDWGSRADDAT